MGQHFTLGANPVQIMGQHVMRNDLLTNVRGVARGGRGASLANRRLSEFLRKKIWLCWDVWPALFSKVTLFSLSEVFCWPQVCQIIRTPPKQLKVFRATTKRSTFLRKSAPCGENPGYAYASALRFCAPNGKFWPRHCLCQVLQYALLFNYTFNDDHLYSPKR